MTKLSGIKDILASFTFEEKYRFLYQTIAEICKEQGIKDPFSYARSKEILAAIELGHTVADDFSGADAIDENGEEVEYKSTIGKRCKGAYTGISVQPSWPEQVRYLREEKLLKYNRHFYNRFANGRLVESWSLTGQQVYDILLPKLLSKFDTVLEKKDPRLSATISWSEIKNNGVRVI
jgi:hypothetical protein